MAGKRDVEAGRAYVRLYIKNSQFLKGVQNISNSFRSVGQGFLKIGAMATAAGAAIVGALTLAAGKFASFGDTLNKMSARTGVSVEVLSGLKFASEQSGASLESVEKGIRKMQQTIGEAAQGLQAYVDTLKILGLSYENLKGLDPESQFEKIAGAIGKISDPTLQAALAMEVFGKGGTQLLPMINSDITALREEARKLGITMSTEDAQAAADYTDAMNRLNKTLEAVWLKVGAAVAPALTDLTDRFAKALGPILAWIDSNREMTAIGLKFGAVVAAVGTGIAAAGAVLVGMAIAISSVGSAFVTIGAGITTVIGILSSPVFYATAAGIAAIGYAAYELYRAGHFTAWIESVSRALGSIADQFKIAWGGISDAIAAGDLGLAMKIAVAGIRVQWLKAVSWLTGTWQGFMIVWSGITTKLASIFVDAMATVRRTWAGALAWMGKAWETWKVSTFTEGLANLLAPLVAVIEGVSVDDVRKNLTEVFARGRDGLGDRQSEIDAQAEAEKRAIEEGRRQQQDALWDAQEFGNSGRARSIIDAQRELDAARAELERLVRQAAEERAGVSAEGGPGKAGELPAPEFEMPNFGSQKAQVQGTFSSAAAAAMAGGGTRPEERTAKAAEATARGVQGVVTAIGGLAGLTQEQTTAIKTAFSFS